MICRREVGDAIDVVGAAGFKFYYGRRCILCLDLMERDHRVLAL